MKLLFLLRSLISTILLIVITAVSSILVLFCAVVLRNQKWTDFFTWIWGRASISVFNVHITVKNPENIPNEGVLFLFNHTSLFDIIIFHSAISKPAHFGAKIELFKIPVFGHAMRASGVLPIVRENRGQVLELYNQSIQRVRHGESFILAGEGTRQPVPGVGPRFKSGPFIFAISGQFPIVPVVIHGAAECLPKGHLIPCTDRWRHEVKVQILKPLSTKGLTLEDRERLQDEAHKLMTEAYNNG